MATYTNFDEKIVLEIMIESLRKEMIRIGFEEGLSSAYTIMVSQQLDTYIVKYQKLILCEVSQ